MIGRTKLNKLIESKESLFNETDEIKKYKKRSL